MYGALQGKNKSETAAKYGEDQVKVSLFISNKQRMFSSNRFAL